VNAPEKVYFKDSEVAITNTKAMMRGKTFAMANITSVLMIEKSPDRTLWFILALFGLAVAGFGVVISLRIHLGVILGILLFLFGILMAMSRKNNMLSELAMQAAY
jgi:hypothetical protein